MSRVISTLIVAIYWSSIVLADEPAETNNTYEKAPTEDRFFRTARERSETKNTSDKSPSEDRFFRSARQSSNLDLGKSSVNQVSKQPVKIETYTVFESNLLPGFRPCASEDYRRQDRDPIACQDDNVARMLSTRQTDQQRNHLVVSDDVQPQGNIYKLRFQRFKKNK